MLEDQKYILEDILSICDRDKIDCMVIAGDIYDKTVPPAEAVQVFDDFLYRVSMKKMPVLVISGNHDSPERISFGGRVMAAGGVYIAPVYNGRIEPVVLSDEFGEVNFYLLPFVKPANVRQYYPDRKIESYTDAISAIIGNISLDKSKRNVLVTHQFVTGSQLSKSEEFFIGGTENVDGGLFDDFDYVALGHIHGAQKMTRETVRYSGTPLKYSFSEANHHKSITIVDMYEKDNVEISTKDFLPLHDMRIIKGTYNEITHRANYEKTNTDDYIQVILTDEEDVADAISRLRTIYPNIMQLKYDNKRTRENFEVGSANDIENKRPIELFDELYLKQNNQNMSDEQREYVSKLIEAIWED